VEGSGQTLSKAEWDVDAVKDIGMFDQYGNNAATGILHPRTSGRKAG
jgi:hypothetical protein